MVTRKENSYKLIYVRKINDTFYFLGECEHVEVEIVEEFYREIKKFFPNEKKEEKSWVAILYYPPRTTVPKDAEEKAKEYGIRLEEYRTPYRV